MAHFVELFISTSFVVSRVISVLEWFTLETTAARELCHGSELERGSSLDECEVVLAAQGVGILGEATGVEP